MRRLAEAIWELPAEGKMRVPARIYATKKILDQLSKDRTLWQLKNVSSLPGVFRWTALMPDAHEGYGFPIGGVAAFDADEGVISPGGVGYDINCGVRLVLTPLREEEVREKLRQLVEELFKAVPSGVGSTGRLHLSLAEVEEVAEQGIDWAIERGFGFGEDKERTEEGGKMEGAEASKISQRAKARGKDQLGTLGAGNHFLEVQVIEEVLEPEVAKDFGLERGMVTVMIHCGSRGFGHQIASDYIKVMLKAAKGKVSLPDPQLAAAPFSTPEAQAYFSAMKGGVNYAFTNRHIIMHWVREAFGNVFGPSVADEMPLLYDVAHNIAKVEEHFGRKLVVHRKGATRAFPSTREEVKGFRFGHPVMIPGSMGTPSYVLVGTEKALEETFGSTCHGSGRVLSRKAATRRYRGETVIRELETRGVMVRAASMKVVAEEAPGAYKDVEEVVKSVSLSGISTPVVRLRPLAVVKG